MYTIEFFGRSFHIRTLKANFCDVVVEKKNIRFFGHVLRARVGRFMSNRPRHWALNEDVSLKKKSEKIFFVQSLDATLRALFKKQASTRSHTSALGVM